MPATDQSIEMGEVGTDLRSLVFIHRLHLDETKMLINDRK
jgi:hypothetical protein